jgi:DNA-binding transcriptional MerR regulator
MDHRDHGYSIAEAAEATGLTTHTLRYYERDGLLLSPPARTSSGDRRYGDLDLSWITMITRLRATGMPIRTVRAYAELCRQGEGNEPERLELLLAHRDRVLEDLARVTEHLGAINRKIGIYEDRLERRATPAGTTA